MIQTGFSWMLRLILAALLLLVLSNCTMLGLNRANLNTDAKPQPVPPLQADSLDAWTAQRPSLKAAFEDNIYGPWPTGTPISLLSRQVVDPDYLNGRAVLEELEIAIGGVAFRLGLAVPDGAEGPLPLIVAQTFSSNCAVFASLALSRADGRPCESTDVPGFVEFIFGEHIAHPPLDAIFDAGFAYASYHASDVVRDSSEHAVADLAAFAAKGGTAPSGAIMAWAFAFSAAIDVLSGDARIDPSRIAVFGHSRHGKSALVAGAWEPRISAVIAHQSGYGGAALSRSTAGEGIDQMIDGARVLPFVRLPGYPHWFDPGFGDYAGRLDDLPVDQHQLLALIAPTPVFLGNARRDVWSDPNSTFRAAAAASAVYGLYKSAGLAASGMSDFRPEDPVAYFLRSGGHGTNGEDMAAILAFLDRHLKAASSSAPAPLTAIE